MTLPEGDRPAAARARALEVLEWTELTAALASECSSASAAREAAALMPHLTEDDARVSLAETAEARRLLAEAGIPVAGVRDVATTLGLAARGGLLEPPDLAAVARTLDALSRLARDLVPRKEAPRLAALAAAIVPAPELVRAIDGAVDEHGRVRDDASARLLELAGQKAALTRRMDVRLEALRRDPEVAAALTDDYVTVRDERRVLPVRSDRRTRVPGILHGRSSSGQSVFIEPAELVELNNELRGVALDMEEEVERILRDLSLAVGRHADDLRASLDAHRAIDLACARGRLASRLSAVEPELGRDRPLELLGLAHPLLLLLRADSPGSVVRNDVRIDPPALGLVITGPNTGGKTVLLKAVGLACLMVRAGLPACCEEGSSVPFLDAVFADIGDEQSLQRSLSSFSGHVAQLSDILAGCAASRGSSLVLLDEIMAGTDPAEGAPLAEALLEALAELGARVVVTTHLGRLKSFAAQHASFANAGMEFDAATLRPTWRVRLGAPGASAALSVAERLGLPARLVDRARDLAGSAQASVEALLRDLDLARAEAGRARDEAQALRAEADRRRVEYERRLAEITRRDAAYVSEERARFEAEMSALREEAVALTRELQSTPSLPAAAEAIRRLEELKARGRAPAGAREGVSGPVAARLVLEPGARVRSVSMERAGVVLEAPDARGRVRVAFGQLTMQVEADDLVDAGGASPSSSRRNDPPRAVTVTREQVGAQRGEVPFTPQTPRNTCDLRGMRVDEALAEVSRFLERARAGGERSVILVHGHGTGALKSAVRAELPGEMRLSAFRSGGDGEGGDGVTVALLA